MFWVVTEEELIEDPDMPYRLGPALSQGSRPDMTPSSAHSQRASQLEECHVYAEAGCGSPAHSISTPRLPGHAIGRAPPPPRPPLQRTKQPRLSAHSSQQ
ncbi:hypothetical protein INR49_030258, partial [Caranx melampygus]